MISYRGLLSSMERSLWLFHMVLALMETLSLAVLPERNCSTVLSLRTDGGTCANSGETTDACNSLSDYLTRYNSRIAASDCLEVKLYPGTYTLTDYSNTLNYSLVVGAVAGGVTITCQPDEAATTGSPLWFQRYGAFSSHPSPPSPSEFFAQIEGVDFESCQSPLQFDAMDYVGISNCNFT